MKALRYFDYILYALMVLIPLMGCSGKQGTVGPSGAAGSQGAQGIQGQAGQNGANGLDGTIIASVQFCPGYPVSAYPEIGLCIDGKLYAEWYNPPSSGLTYLPDGTYLSTQTGAACTFNVVGCSVSSGNAVVSQ